MKIIVLLLLLLFGNFGFSQQVFDLNFQTEKTDKGYQIFVNNNEFTPMSVKVKWELSNMKSSLPDDQLVVVPAQTQKFLLANLNFIDRTKGFSFRYQTSYNMGNVEQTDYDADYIYDLPFASQKSYLIWQGYNGNFSHQNENSLDFNLKEGDKIFAVREGKVVSVVENNNQNCSTNDCAKYNNLIRILHSDGTFAEYAHLKFNGAEVQAGQEVKKGDFIGYSGNTGWSQGPHLHFSVFLNTMDGKRKYLQTLFRTSNSEPEFLKEKKSYTKNY